MTFKALPIKIQRSENRQEGGGGGGERQNTEEDDKISDTEYESDSDIYSDSDEE